MTPAAVVRKGTRNGGRVEPVRRALESIVRT
jgi:hypothetical protein